MLRRLLTIALVLVATPAAALHLGDFPIGATIDFKFNTRTSAGAPITLAGTPSLTVYKANGDVQDGGDLTLTVDFDTVTGMHHVRLDTSIDTTFYVAGDFQVVVSQGTVNGQSVAGQVVASFSLENRSALRPSVTGRELDVTATGEAGIDWANIGSPTTVVNLSGTTVKTATDVATTLGTPAGASVSADILTVYNQDAQTKADTDDIQTRLPAGLVGGRMDSNVGAISSDAAAADNAEAFFDGTGYAGTGNVIPTVTTVTNGVTVAAGGLTAASVADGAIDAGALAADTITAAKIATDALGSDELAATAVTEITAGLSIPTVGQIAAEVWNTSVPASFLMPTAGYRMQFLDAAISTRSTDVTDIEIVSPILEGGVLELVAGDAYDQDHARALDKFALTGQPSLTGATVTFVIKGILSVTAVSVSGAGGATQTPIFELTAAQTALLTRKGAEAYDYQIQATWAADSPAQPAVLARGKVTVIERVAP